jgi:DNA-directed RNA polymerase specialized sigma24 family protein
MITITKQVHQNVKANENERFLDMLPRILSQARRAFRYLRPEHKDELVQEVVVNAYSAFVRLVRRGKADVAFATPLTNYAIRQVIAGRRVANKPKLSDVMSPQAHSAHGFLVERLDVFDEKRSQWRQVLVEDRSAGPAEIAAARIDVAAWLCSLSPRSRRIAKALAMGETTTDVAQKFNVSRPRVSQFREELKASWEKFHERGQQYTGQASLRT